MAMSLESMFFQGDDQGRWDHTPGSAVANGVIVDLGELIGICTSPEGIAANALGSLATKGVFRVSKTGNAYNQGQEVFFDTVTRLALPFSGANTIFIGLCALAAVAGDNDVKVDINRQIDQAATSTSTTTTTTTTTT